MPTSTLPRCLLLALLTLAGTACASPGSEPGPAPSGRKSEPKMCTEMACFDGAAITTKLTAAGAPLGTHEFTLELDGVAQTCTIEFTKIDETARAECSSGASLMFGPAKRGVETNMGDMVGYHEEVIPGEFEWQLNVPGTPKAVHVVHTHAGATIVDQTGSFSYTERRPNGEGCDPVCQTASLDWKGP